MLISCKKLNYFSLTFSPNKVINNLNINSIRNKFEQLKQTVLKYVDILVVNEAKLDENFLESLFLMNGFSKSYRLDRKKNGGGIIILICN